MIYFKIPGFFSGSLYKIGNRKVPQILKYNGPSSSRRRYMANNAILVVDDDLTLGELLAVILEDYFTKFEIKTAHSGQDAWEMVKEYHPRLVISDMHMPHGSGIELFRNISKSGFSDIGFILMSGELTEKELGLFRKEGLEHFIKKPFQSTDLRDKVNEILDQDAKQF